MPTPVKIVLAVIAALLVVFIAIILIRTLMFKPKPNAFVEENEVVFDKEAATNALAELIRCKTVSNSDPSKEDDAEFEKLINKLPKLYPYVFEKCELTRLDGRGLLFFLKGKSSEKPTVLMAHYDVVPVNEDMWDHDPFGAEIIDNVMWGRGTLDTKVTFNGVLFSANHLLKDNFVPENDMYFAFSGGEEVSGPGAVNIVNYLKEKGVHPYLVLDEGGAVVENIFPGVKIPCGLVGIAEKGMMNVQYKFEGNGGHASAPKPHTPVGVLSKACCDIENHPFKYHLSKPVAEMFDTLGRHSSFVYRMIFANLWCFGPVLDSMCKKSGGNLNALMRTTVAFTQMSGSKQENVIPPTATMVSNMRLNPEDSVASAKAYLEKTINNPEVKLTILHSDEPSPVSKVHCESFDKVASAVASTWKGCIVAPYLMIQCSDSRHYSKISEYVYKFSAMDLKSEELGLMHGNNERIRLETLYRAVEFYIRLVSHC